MMRPMTRFIALFLIAAPLALLGPSPAEAVTIEKVESPGGIIAWLVEDHSIPVVSTRISGIPELVEDGVTGLLVPPADPAALADALERLAHDPELGRRMGRAGRAKVLREFDLTDNTTQLAHKMVGEAR